MNETEKADVNEQDRMEIELRVLEAVRTNFRAEGDGRQRLWRDVFLFYLPNHRSPQYMADLAVISYDKRFSK